MDHKISMYLFVSYLAVFTLFFKGFNLSPRFLRDITMVTIMVTDMD